MSEHAQALELSTKVHSVFGYTLLLAGVTRIIEVCFIAPTFEKDGLASSSASSDSDRHSERTLALSTSGLGGEKENPRIAVAHAFRHFPPFVSKVFVVLVVHLLRCCSVEHPTSQSTGPK